jgi:hypothetical protein
MVLNDQRRRGTSRVILCRCRGAARIIIRAHLKDSAAEFVVAARALPTHLGVQVVLFSAPGTVNGDLHSYISVRAAMNDTSRLSF